MKSSKHNLLITKSVPEQNTLYITHQSTTTHTSTAQYS
jgi:hypothetical protein